MHQAAHAQRGAASQALPPRLNAAISAPLAWASSRNPLAAPSLVCSAGYDFSTSSRSESTGPPKRWEKFEERERERRDSGASGGRRASGGRGGPGRGGRGGRGRGGEQRQYEGGQRSSYGDSRAPALASRLRDYPPRRDERMDEDDAEDREDPDMEEEDGEAAAADQAAWRPSNIRDEIVEDVLYGVFPVLNALKIRRRKLHALYVLSMLDLSKRKDASAMREIFKLAKELDLPIKKAPRHDLNLLSDSRPHQGLVLDCSPLQWGQLDAFPTAAEIAAATPGAAAPVWLALDEVMDPQNFGAVVRSAHCLGASGILACSRNCAPLSPAVSKASAGVLEVGEVHSCQNMVKTLAQAVADGWEVLGATADGKSQSCRSIRVTKPTILVVGNEGSGLRTNVKRACSGFVKVEMGLPRQQLAADSLNVSVAAGILMHSLVGSADAEAASRSP